MFWGGLGPYLARFAPAFSCILAWHLMRHSCSFCCRNLGAVPYCQLFMAGAERVFTGTALAPCTGTGM